MGRTVEIRFILPQQATDGERLTKPLEIELLRSQIPRGSAPSAAPTLALWLKLLPDQWAPYASEQEITYVERLSEEQFKAWQAADSIIAVRTLTRGFRHRPIESDFSGVVRLRLLDVSGSIEGVQSQITEKAIKLRWLPPARTLRGGQPLYLAGYRIYKSTTGKPDSFNLAGESQEPRYADTEFEFGSAYSYEVRAVFKESTTTAESESSPPYQVIARDTFPPTRPSSLTALYTTGAVELVWTANTEKDLAGYYVYRRENGGRSERLNKDLLRTPILRDASVEQGRVYIYQVTAVDLSKNESPPSEEVSVETQN